MERGLFRVSAAIRDLRRWKRQPTVREDVASRLREALADEALITAAHLAEQLATQLAGMRTEHRREAAIDVIRVFLAHGRYAEATALARQHAESLTGTGYEATMLDVSSLVQNAEPESCVFPGGRLNSFVLSKAIDAGRIRPEGLATLFLRHREAYLRDPQLDLLMASASRRTSECSESFWINRFLAWHALPRAMARRRSDNVLGDIEFEIDSNASDGPLVSVIMSAHEAASTVGYAMRSILRQTYRNLELLVVDDASTDDTARVVQEHARCDPRVRAYRSVENQGTFNIRNRLFELSRGSVIAFQDADDLAMPTRIESQVRSLRGGRVASLANWVRVRPPGSFVFFRDQQAIRLSVVSLAVTRDALRSVAPYRCARFGADLEVLRRLQDRFGSARFARIRKPLLFGLWSEQSLTRRSGGEALEDGYRSPGRRLYGELIAQRRRGLVSDEEIDRQLSEDGNFAEPREIVPL